MITSQCYHKCKAFTSIWCIALISWTLSNYVCTSSVWNQKLYSSKADFTWPASLSPNSITVIGLKFQHVSGADGAMWKMAMCGLLTNHAFSFLNVQPSSSHFLPFVILFPLPVNFCVFQQKFHKQVGKKLIFDQKYENLWIALCKILKVYVNVH